MLSVLKRYEDVLDALVCAWVGVCFVEGAAEAYGDDVAAIWVPRTASAGDRSPARSHRDELELGALWI